MNYSSAQFIKKHILFIMISFITVSFAAIFALLQFQGSLDPRSQAANRNSSSVAEIKKAPSVTQPGESLFGNRASYDRNRSEQSQRASNTRVNIFSDTQTGEGTVALSGDVHYISDLAVPMTGSVVKIICPADSKDVDCQYFGGDGLQKAINESQEGSRTNATQLLLKQGRYFREISEQFVVFDEKGQVQTRSAYYLIGGANGNDGKHIIISSFDNTKRATLSGFLVYPANGLVVTGGRVDIKGINITSYSPTNCVDYPTCKGGTGLMAFNDARLHVDSAVFEENQIALRIFDNSLAHIINTTFRFNGLRSMDLLGYSTADIANVTVEGGENGIFLKDTSTAVLSNSTIKRVKNKGMQLLYRANVVIAKLAIDSASEGIMTFGDSKATITDVTLKKVQDNIAAIDKSQITITGLTIDGGNSGVSSHVESMITVARGDLKNISNNNVGIYDKSHMSISRLVTSGGIAGVALDTNASAKVSNSTFYGNTEVGINLGCHGSVGRQSVDLVNNIVFGTKKQFNACGSGSAYNFGGKAAKQTIDVKDFRANWAFNSSSNDFGGFEKFTQWLASDKLNRVADPQFVNAAIGDFHLKPGSPALTAGIDGKEVGVYGQGDGPVEPLKQKTVITLVSQDGSTAYSRECEGQRGIVDTSACDQWVTYDLSAIRVGVPAGQTYSGISSIVYKEGDSTKVLLQSLLDKSSSKAWYRRCRFKAREDVHYRNCSDWSEVDTGTIEGITKKTIGIEGYIEATGHANYYVQSLLSDDGITAYSRTCELTNREILFRECLRYKKVNLSGIKLAEDSALTFTDLDSWYSSTHFNQSILLSDGIHYMFRSCTFGGSGVNFRQCSPFTKYSISDHDNKWNKEWRVAGIDSFTYEY